MVEMVRLDQYLAAYALKLVNKCDRSLSHYLEAKGGIGNKKQRLIQQTSLEEMIPQDWPGGRSVRLFLNDCCARPQAPKGR